MSDASSQTMRLSTPDSSPSPTRIPPLTTQTTPSLSRSSRYGMHVPKISPATRQNPSTNWPHGVLSGGMLIDMLEELSRTSRPTDWGFTLWLQEHYIAPFGRVERLDGLIVASTGDRRMIRLAHERYIDVMGEKVKVQRLWVPGLEPTYESAVGDESPLPFGDPPKNAEQQVWIGSNMYYKDGIEVARKGLSVGEWTDELRWERKIWMAPNDTVHAEECGKGKAKK